MSIQPLSNSFTKEFGIEFPLVSAPMSYASTPQMAAAIINGGGIATIGAGNEPPENLVRDIEAIRKAISPNKYQCIGIGYVGWVLDRADPNKKHPLESILETEIGIIWLAFGNDLVKYIKQIREYDAKRSHKTKIFVQLNTVEEVKRAAQDWNVDAIIVQGAEAGGRGSSYSPPLAEFLQGVKEAVPSGPHIIAAGGITTGSQIASVLTLGVSAVVLGTRFLFTNECMWPPHMKNALLKAELNSTVRSPAYDIVFPPNVWPKGIEARCVKNKIIDDYKEGLPPAERKQHIDTNENDYLVVYAGVGAGLLNKLQNTADVMTELRTGTIAALNASYALIAGSNARF